MAPRMCFTQRQNRFGDCEEFARLRFIHACMHVCVCVQERESESEREREIRRQRGEWLTLLLRPEKWWEGGCRDEMFEGSSESGRVFGETRWRRGRAVIPCFLFLSPLC